MHTGPANNNKTERAYSVIRERIFNRTYGPGYRLVIDALAQELGISPVPIREAIRRLEAEGWVIYRANSGAQVANADANTYEEELSVLAILEGHATALAAPYLSPEDLQKLQEMNNQLQALVESADLHAFSHCNQEFHFFIYARCPNSYLVKLLRETWERLSIRGHTDFTYIPQRARESVAEHTELLDAIANQATSREIEDLMNVHKSRTRAAYLNSPRYAH